MLQGHFRNLEKDKIDGHDEYLIQTQVGKLKLSLSLTTLYSSGLINHLQACTTMMIDWTESDKANWGMHKSNHWYKNWSKIFL